MMDYVAFAPLIDIPLAIAVAIGFVVHFNGWATSTEPDTTVDLVSRLPVARMRAVALTSAVLGLCWLTDLAFWLILVALFGVGIAVVLVTGAGPIEGDVMVLFVACAIREWSFGFPQWILEPPPEQSTKETDTMPPHPLMGCHGTTKSPLRPSGDVEFDDSVESVVSEDGCLIDAGVEVVVTGFRNGRLCVRPLDAE